MPARASGARSRARPRPGADAVRFAVMAPKHDPLSTSADAAFAVALTRPADTVEPRAAPDAATLPADGPPRRQPSGVDDGAVDADDDASRPPVVDTVGSLVDDGGGFAARYEP